MARPKKYTEAEALQAKIDEYFADCDRKGKPYTICGLAEACNLTRQSLINYSENPEFLDTIKKAKAKCEVYAEEQLYLGKNVAGVIFSLKNNYGWTDKTEQTITGDFSLNKVFITPKEAKETNEHIDEFINEK